jgi:hypothetical protein
MSLRSKIRRQLADQTGQISMLLRLGPPTLDAYLQITRTLVTERVWNLPPRIRSTAPESPGLAPMSVPASEEQAA